VTDIVKNLSVNILPKSSNNTLQGWNAADEFIVSEWKSLNSPYSKTSVYNDRYGFLSLHTSPNCLYSCIINQSQKSAIIENHSLNGLITPQFITPLETEIHQNVEFCFVQIPKSLGLFRLYLHHIYTTTNDDVIVLAGFMTKHFTKQYLEVANEFFDTITQSLGWKKARVLSLKNKKRKLEPQNLITSVEYKKPYKQFVGVFSGDHIDYATQFLLSVINLKSHEIKILDLGCGNGIIADYLSIGRKNLELYLLDDNILAVESAKLNVPSGNVIWDYNLDSFDDTFFDVVVTNPPFHFEHQIDISVPLNLFENCKRIIKTKGRLIIVANKHLNYKTHLTKWYESVEVLSENNKFVIYQCVK